LLAHVLSFLLPFLLLSGILSEWALVFVIVKAYWVFRILLYGSMHFAVVCLHKWCGLSIIRLSRSSDSNTLMLKCLSMNACFLVTVIQLSFDNVQLSVCHAPVFYSIVMCTSCSL